jgi:hypothetical protein
VIYEDNSEEQCLSVSVWNMSTKGLIDYYANEINDIIDSFRIDKQNITLKRLEDFKKDIEDERDEMQKDRWESIEDGGYQETMMIGKKWVGYATCT